MNKYIVKSGQNLFDIALAIYGSIEGVFDLLTSNPDVKGQALSFDSILPAGVSLNYNEEYIINKNIKDNLEDLNVKVANGEHIFKNANISESISNALDDYNSDILKQANSIYPGVYSDGSIMQGSNLTLQRLFMLYILQNYIGSGNSDLELLAQKIVYNKTKTKSTDIDKLYYESISATRLIVKQIGVISSFTAKLVPKKILAIDWGDADNLEIFVNCQEEKIFEHCYNDNGNHIITLYGDFIFDTLDFTNLNGVYYPTSIIKVNEKFTNNLGNETYNKLIEVNNE